MNLPLFKRGKVVNYAIIDWEDLGKVSGFHWTDDRYPIGYKRGSGLVRLHRLIMNCPEGKEIDHINGNKLDNRKSNLRVVSRSQNIVNRKKNRGTSLFKGVSKCWKSSTWRAQINKDGVNYRLGNFNSEEEAALAYNNAAKEFHKGFVILNEV